MSEHYSIYQNQSACKLLLKIGAPWTLVVSWYLYTQKMQLAKCVNSDWWASNGWMIVCVFLMSMNQDYGMNDKLLHYAAQIPHDHQIYWATFSSLQIRSENVRRTSLTYVYTSGSKGLLSVSASEGMNFVQLVSLFLKQVNVDGLARQGLCMPW